jgi:hypothetical protein
MQLATNDCQNRDISALQIEENTLHFSLIHRFTIIICLHVFPRQEFSFKFGIQVHLMISKIAVFMLSKDPDPN